MKLLNTLLLLSAALAVAESVAPTSCYVTGDDGNVEKTTCPTDGGAITNCQSPKIWIDYLGYDTTDATDTAKFACATGPAVSACSNAAKKCVVCNEAGNDCNVPKTSTDFKCYKWTYANKAWKKADKSTVCKITTDDKKMCNAPNREKAEEDTTSANGCGPCATDKYNAETCQECYGAECNGSAFLSVSVLLAALSAIVYLV